MQEASDDPVMLFGGMQQVRRCDTPRETDLPVVCSRILESMNHLGNIARKVSFGSTGRLEKWSLSEEEVQEQKLLKWALQAEARYILPDERVAQCLRQVNPLAAGVELLHSPEHQVAHYKSLIICGSVWMCPLCAAKISERRREELERAISRHIAHNGVVFMATYTIAHSRFDDLSRLLQAFLRAKKRMK